MKTLGNILWFILFGLWDGILWILAGVIMCATIIGIPVGVQCFKLAGFVFWPFKKDIRFGGGGGSAILNILWIVLGGIELALTAWLFGLIFCITIIGIPFGKQCFKIAKLALTPFGAQIVDASTVK